MEQKINKLKWNDILTEPKYGGEIILYYEDGSLVPKLYWVSTWEQMITPALPSNPKPVCWCYASNVLSGIPFPYRISPRQENNIEEENSEHFIYYHTQMLCELSYGDAVKFTGRLIHKGFSVTMTKNGYESYTVSAEKVESSDEL